MMPLDYSKTQRLLLAVASPGEFSAVLRGFDRASETVPEIWGSVELDAISILHTGVGKANAAGGIARQLSLRDKGNSFKSVLSIGIAGSFDREIGLCSSVLGLKHWMLDEGTVLQSDIGWQSLEEAGWAITSIDPDRGELHQFLKTRVDHTADVGTVSTISGTNMQMNDYLRRAPVKIETMESCAAALVCANLKVEFADVRIISNFCGERTKDNNDFPGALKSLSEFVRHHLW